jgi:periplasmic protein CpxP/Spy
MSKKLIVALSLFVASFAVSIETINAQDNGNAQSRQDQTPDQKVDNQLQRLTKALTLTADQSTQIKPMLVELNQKRAAMRDASDKRAAMKDMRDLVMTQDEKMKTILSADQYTKYQNMKDDMKDRMKGKRGRRE